MIRSVVNRVAVAVLASLVLLTPAAAGEELGAASTFSVITHKAGVGASLAHNHLVRAPKALVQVELGESPYGDARFELVARADELQVDDEGAQKLWFPRLEELGILDEPFGKLSDKDRRKIRRSMLGPEQLDADSHPKIVARLTSLAEEESQVGEITFSHRGTLQVELHGTAREVPVAARLEEIEGATMIEAVGTFRTSDFGIKPYSALFGAVRNQDEVHLYARFPVP